MIADQPDPAVGAEGVPGPGAEEGLPPGSLALPALGGGAASFIGWRLGGAAGAMVAGGGVPYATVMLQRMAGEWSGDWARRIEQMLETAGKILRLSPHQLTERGAQTERARHLTEVAVRAAAESFWPPTVRAIGRAYAAGLLATDDTEVDVRQHALEVMADLGPLHVELLELLVKCQPDVKHEGLQAVPHRIPSYVNTFLGGDRPDNPKVWSSGNRAWPARYITAVRPQLQPVLLSLLGALEQHGLAAQNDTAPDVAKLFIEDLIKQVNRQAGQMQRGQSMRPITLQQPNPRNVQPTWSPTELGEKVLGFYAEAGEEAGSQPPAPADSPPAAEPPAQQPATLEQQDQQPGGAPQRQRWRPVWVRRQRGQGPA